MTFIETGDWRIVMLIDGTDTEGKATYQQIYQHQDGRKACVGPGYCSDPDLEWLLLQKDRTYGKEALVQREMTKRFDHKNSFSCLYKKIVERWLSLQNHIIVLLVK